MNTMWVWGFFKIVPFTQMKRLKDNLSNISEYARENKDNKCAEFIKAFLHSIWE